MTNKAMCAFVRDTMLPDIIEQLGNAVAKIVESGNIGVVLIITIDDEGNIASTVSRESALALMRDAAEKIALEMIMPEGPVQ